MGRSPEGSKAPMAEKEEKNDMLTDTREERYKRCGEERQQSTIF
jgi:hypothetical protein